MAKLIIKTETKQVSEIEISTPRYFRDKSCNEYIGLLDENTMISITSMNDLTIITSSNPSKSQHSQSQLENAYHKFHNCQEFEFIEKYDEVIASMYKHHKLAI